MTEFSFLRLIRTQLRDFVQQSIRNINDHVASSKNDGFYLNSETTDNYQFKFVHVTLNYYTPREILDALCKKVFKEDVNALLVVNNKPLSGTSVPTPQYLSRLGKKKV